MHVTNSVGILNCILQCIASDHELVLIKPLAIERWTRQLKMYNHYGIANAMTPVAKEKESVKGLDYASYRTSRTIEPLLD